MAHNTLAVLSRSDFHSAFLDREIFQLDNLITHSFAKAHLSECAFSNEYVSCAEVATVHHLASEQEFCARHFRAVSRG